MADEDTGRVHEKKLETADPTVSGENMVAGRAQAQPSAFEVHDRFESREEPGEMMS